MAEAGVAVVHPFMKGPVDKGFLSALFAATSGRVGDEQINGVYVVPECKVTGPRSHARDEQLHRRLWDVLKGRLGDVQSLREQA